MILIRAVAAAGLAAAALFTAQTASAGPVEDEAFLAALEEQGLTYPSEAYAIQTANEVCDLLDDGSTVEEVAEELSDNSGLPLEDTGFFVGASVGAYCPQHGDDL